MEIKLKGREMPRGPAGDVRFTSMHAKHECGGQGPCEHEHQIGVRDVFTRAEVVELVNRALYQLEYQRESHRKRSMKQRELVKAGEEALRAAGVDVDARKVKEQLEGK